MFTFPAICVVQAAESIKQWACVGWAPTPSPAKCPSYLSPNCLLQLPLPSPPRLTSSKPCEFGHHSSFLKGCTPGFLTLPLTPSFHLKFCIPLPSCPADSQGPAGSQGIQADRRKFAELWGCLKGLYSEVGLSTRAASCKSHHRNSQLLYILSAHKAGWVPT